ncbi:MAG: PAS domain S-box protein [Candidatus Viridilinea halotolerans]|uniref:histidine kinase n=1 Tax=Candidatus Viridilinea halotolerans TaxID=2491704 RepID=A0A426TY75_9CHLR|nr:MAG: PAS domain S-box protein [Candidatus Viridilinea halotolerans]
MNPMRPGDPPDAEHLRLLIENAADLIYRYRLEPEPGFTYVSPAASAMTGHSPEEFYADPELFVRLVHPNDRGLFQAILAGNVAPMRATLLRWERSDGILIWTEHRNRVVHDHSGRPVVVEGIARDVSDRRRTEEALSQALESERLARYVAEVLHSANMGLTHSLEADQVMAALLEHLGRLVPYDSANVMLLDSNGQLVIRASRGYQRFGYPDGPPFEPLVLKEEPILEPILQRRRSFLIMDTLLTERWRKRPGFLHIRNWFGVPLIAGEQIIGLFCLDKAEPAFFTPEHVDLAELLATPAAIAVQNARLFAEVRSGRERMRALSERLVAVQETERAHLARELHDEIGQMLTSLSLALTVNERMPADMLRERISQVQRQVNQLTSQVRTLSLNLRPAMLDDLGLLPALIWFTRRYADQTGIQVQFQHAGLDGVLTPAIGATAYRVVQESLTNIARHAQVRHARVQVWTTDRILAVQVVDEGCGFEVEQALTSYSSSGLAGMQERVRLAGGELSVTSAPDEGTRILAELPLGGGEE